MLDIQLSIGFITGVTVGATLLVFKYTLDGIPLDADTGWILSLPWRKVVLAFLLASTH